jgi:hypothetical protein
VSVCGSLGGAVSAMITPSAVTGLARGGEQGQSATVPPSHVPHIGVLALCLTTPSRTRRGEEVVREWHIPPARGSLTTAVDGSVPVLWPSADLVSWPSSGAPSLTDAGR